MIIFMQYCTVCSTMYRMYIQQVNDGKKQFANVVLWIWPEVFIWWEHIRKFFYNYATVTDIQALWSNRYCIWFKLIYRTFVLYKQLNRVTTKWLNRFLFSGLAYKSIYCRTFSQHVVHRSFPVSLFKSPLLVLYYASEKKDRTIG